MLRGPEGWRTPVYAKPTRNGEKLNRMDFGSTNAFPQERAQALLKALEEATLQADAVVFNQQLPGSIISSGIMPELNALIARHPKVVFIVNSRDHAGLFERAILKVNAHEAARLAGVRGLRSAFR
ncbi:MAG: hypothetical protein Q7Q73_02720 [Verrucomicrobiota bacterium JB024]|nr:hypothetical protein [Verrucomicrobiota bacterium JB024]